MILYVNGDSHSAGAETANNYCFAEDDPLYWAMGRRPHPDNLRASYGCELANMMYAVLECDAESAASNTRILRTTEEYLKDNTPDYLIIGWSTWEREEWLHEGTYFQVTSSGTDQVPTALKDQYKQWVIDQEHVTRERKLLQWHDQIYKFHLELKLKNIPHLFFNTYSDFSNIRSGKITTHAVDVIPAEYDWDECYVGPYDQNYTYYFWLKDQGFDTVNPNSYHFGADAHAAWAAFLYQTYIQK